MHVLLLGGTGLIGRHLTNILLGHGHGVTVLARGMTAHDLPAHVERLLGDRDDGERGLSALRGRVFDAVVDISGYTPRQVRASAELLASVARRYVFVSAVSVYGDPGKGPVRESHPLLLPAREDVTEIDGETYGPLKVACEQVVRDVYGERATIVRPQIVVGPFDLSGRYTFWLDRAAAGGEMLAPGDGSDHLQVIDVRDLARFVVRVVERGVGGAFNLAGPRLTWRAFMELLGVRTPVWVSADLLRAQGLTFVELPLYRPEGGARSALMDVDLSAALAAGLTLTDPAVTARETRAWSEHQQLPRALSGEREAHLIRLARGG